MEYLPLANKVQEGDLDTPPITAKDKHVIVIGGGDTGADCVGTAHRQGAADVTQLEIMPNLNKVTSAHEEGGERIYSVNTVEFLGDDQGNVRALQLVEVERTDQGLEAVEGTEREIPADLVTLAMGFVGPEKAGLLDELGVELDGRGNVVRDSDYRTTVDGVFCAGDMGRASPSSSGPSPKAAPLLPAWTVTSTTRPTYPSRSRPPSVRSCERNGHAVPACRAQGSPLRPARRRFPPRARQ